MKVEVLSSTVIVSLIICGEKILIFYNKSEEGKSIEKRERKLVYMKYLQTCACVIQMQ